MPEADAGTKKKVLVPLNIGTPSPRSPRRLRFRPDSPISPHTLNIPFSLGLTGPLTRNDRSENDLDSFAQGGIHIAHAWIDDRELSH
ncbi:hypothetical protein L9F63_013400, partial [Diploptera punctata]